jgi:Ca2+-dependent lipid-binding protein
MVALNYQNDGLVMSLAYGKFLDNGGCGYILKPKYLNDIDQTKFNPFNYTTKPSRFSSNLDEHPQRLIITIISGQFIPRSNGTTNDIPDPYVVISTHGISCDQQTKKTKFIENNGFDPMWNETFQFDIHFPQMCLVRFDVYDHDRFTRDDRLLYFCLPMTTIQKG